MLPTLLAMTAAPELDDLLRAPDLQLVHLKLQVIPQDLKDLQDLADPQRVTNNTLLNPLD